MSNSILPTEKVEVGNRNPKKLVLYGPPKVGKTGLLAELDSNLIIDLEDGSDYVEALKMKAIGFNAPKDETPEQKEARQQKGKYYLQEIGTAIVNAGKPYNRVSIDTVTKLEEWCEKLGTTMYKSTPQGKSFEGKTVLELEYGAGYYWLRQAYKKWMKKLSTLADTVIYVGHVKDKFIQKEGKDASAKDLDLTGKIRNITASDADAIGYLYRNPANPYQCMVSFKSEELVMCGSRCAHLRGQEFILSEADKDGNIIESHWDKIFID